MTRFSVVNRGNKFWKVHVWHCTCSLYSVVPMTCNHDFRLEIACSLNSPTCTVLILCWTRRFYIITLCFNIHCCVFSPFTVVTRLNVIMALNSFMSLVTQGGFMSATVCWWAGAEVHSHCEKVNPPITKKLMVCWPPDLPHMVCLMAVF